MHAYKYRRYNWKSPKGSDSSSNTRAKTKVSYATIVVSLPDNDRTNRRVSSREEQYEKKKKEEQRIIEHNNTYKDMLYKCYLVVARMM